MYDYISGKIVSKTPIHVIIDSGGIGYHIHISLNTYSRLKDSGTVTVYTHLSIKEDAHILYGFADERERKLFRHLISVSGVGASTARMMLSSLTTEEVEVAIVTGNTPVLQGIKGIGAKSAQRIIIDLKDKLAKSDTSKFISLPGNTQREEALSALITLGFAKNTAEKSLDHILKAKGMDVPADELVRSALNSL